MCVEKESCDKGYDIGAMGNVLSQQEFLVTNQYAIFEGCHYCYLFYSFVIDFCFNNQFYQFSRITMMNNCTTPILQLVLSHET